MKTTKFTLTKLADLQAIITYLVERLGPGRHLGLIGPVGAGKTTLVQHLAQALGVTGFVDSPTFTIRAGYALPPGGKIERLIHYDLYRLDTKTGLTEIGFFDDWRPARDLLVIEWIDRFPDLAATVPLLLTISVDHHRGRRKICLEERL